MEVWQAIILGIIQGITEFLPISSTGHLELIPRLLHWDRSIATGTTFVVALHAGTLIALLGYFWRDWVGILRAAIPRLRRDQNVSDYSPFTLWALVIASIPAGVAGLLLNDEIDALETSSDPAVSNAVMLVIAAALIVMAALLWAADRYGSKRKKEIVQTGFWDWITIGVAQAVALIPGVSRSGSTISAGLAMGLDRATAARFSFLLSTPIVMAAVLLKLKEAFHTGLPAGEIMPFAAGLVSSAIVGYLAIKFLLAYITRHSMNLFVWYRIALGAAIIGIVVLGPG